MPDAVSVARLSECPSTLALELDGSGAPVDPVLLVDLDDTRSLAPDAVHRLAETVADSRRVLVGVATGRPHDRLEPLIAALSCTLVPATAGVASTRCVPVADLPSACSELVDRVAYAPRAATALVDVLRLTSGAPTAVGLTAESLAYSMLLAGPEFARWRAGRLVRTSELPLDPVVLVDRDGDVLHVTLSDPRRHNAFGRHIRDGLVEAFDLALLDNSITRIELTGAGRSFCSGGDLDEFGSTRDVGAAHLIRLTRSVASRLDRCRDRVRVVVHGACIGAGVELPSFADRVEARADAYFQLPELAMGLVPGAGGTVGITRRIGRWRTAFLALTGARIDVEQALSWGLVDARA